MARWTKKSLVFAITRASDQVEFLDQIKRKLKINFHVKADQRGITLTLRGDAEQVRLAAKRVQGIYRSLKT